MAYTARIPDLSRRAAFFVDRIIKGAKPADLPIEQPTNFEFIINMKTAQVLGLDMPATLLAEADEVIESAVLIDRAPRPNLTFAAEIVVMHNTAD
jgi:putative ABC transport system substrate-binding protein